MTYRASMARLALRPARGAFVRERRFLHLQMNRQKKIHRASRCDLGRKRSSFLLEMSSSPARRSFTVNTFLSALLALVALGVAWVGFSDYLRIQNNIARSRDELVQAEASLAQVKYDEQGNVVDADRSTYQRAMSTMQIHTDSIRGSRAQVPNVYPFVGGGVVAFLVFGFMAVRSTRRA
jgi:hypothetical protein